jgi:hypothetical protein
MAQETKQKPRAKEAPVMPKEAHKHMHMAFNEFGQSIKALLPTAFIEHRRAARREMLLAARSLIDYALERIKEADTA